MLVCRIVISRLYKRRFAANREMALSQVQKQRKTKAKPTHTVSFRLDEDYLLKLERISAKRGNSIHEQARDMLMALLNGDELDLMTTRLEVESIHKMLSAHTKGTADLLEALLVVNGVDEDTARSWVDERLRKRALDK